MARSCGERVSGPAVPAGVAALMPADPERLLDGAGEVVVGLASGWTLRSGADECLSGEYVRLCRPDGSELVSWDSDEWRDDPVLVMGAIVNAAATTTCSPPCSTHARADRGTPASAITEGAGEGMGSGGEDAAARRAGTDADVPDEGESIEASLGIFARNGHWWVYLSGEMYGPFDDSDAAIDAVPGCIRAAP